MTEVYFDCLYRLKDGTIIGPMKAPDLDCPNHLVPRKGGKKHEMWDLEGRQCRWPDLETTDDDRRIVAEVVNNVVWEGKKWSIVALDVKQASYTQAKR